MVMTVLVDMDDNICVSHDQGYEGIPVKVIYDKEKHALNLVVSRRESESEVYLGKIAPPKIVEKILNAKEIRIKQMAIGEQSNDTLVPLDFRDTSSASPVRPGKKAAVK